MNEWTSGSYTTDLAKMAAGISEMTQILSQWTPGVSLDELERRVVAAGALGRVSVTRVRDIVKRTFRRRFLVPDDSPARYGRRVLQEGEGASEFRELVFLFSLRSHLVMYDFLVEGYWPAAFAGHENIHGSQIAMHIKGRSGTPRLPRPWSDNVIARVARNLGKALTDFGLFESGRTTVRRIRFYQPSDFLVLFLLHEAHQAGVDNTALLSLAEWEALGLARADVVDRARHLAGVNGAFLFQYSGELAQFTWRYHSVQEFLDAYLAA